MSNFQIYRKTLPLSLLRILYSFIGLVVLIALPAAAFLITMNMSEQTCGIATVAALAVGLVGYILLSRYVSYLLGAGQIAMITEGVTTGSVPDHVVESGKKAVKARFLTVNVYFALKGTISAITNQLTRGINAATTALGGLGGEDGASVGSTIGSAISAVVAIVLEYVNYCCLGWVFRNGEQNAFKSTCDGAVIYFQNWKTLLKNVGKIIAISLVSLIVIGVPLMALAGVILGGVHGTAQLMTAIGEALECDPDTALYVCAFVLGLLAWLVVHGALVKPYILVSVMRKYMESAEQNPPKFDMYGKLCGLSKRFKDAFTKSGETVETVEA